MAALTGQMAVEIEMVIELKQEPTMAENTDAQIRHVYEQWHETIKVRDLDGLMALYARMPSSRPVYPGNPEGQEPKAILKRQSQHQAFSSRPDFAIPESGLGRWYRPERSSPTAGS